MRVVNAPEAVAGIRSGQQIYLHSAAATPSMLLDANKPNNLRVSDFAAAALSSPAVATTE